MLNGGTTSYLEGTLSLDISEDTMFPVGTAEYTDIHQLVATAY